MIDKEPIVKVSATDSPRQDELSYTSNQQEESFRKAIRTRNFSQIQEFLNEPANHNILTDKKSQISQTINYAQMDLWKDQSLSREEKLEYSEDLTNIMNSIRTKTQEIEKTQVEANREPTFGEKIANFFSRIVQAIKSIFSSKSEEPIQPLNTPNKSTKIGNQQEATTPQLQQNRAVNKQILNEATKLASKISTSAEDVQKIPNSAEVNRSKSATQRTEQQR